MMLDLHEVATHLGKRIRYVIDEPPVEDPDAGVHGLERVTGEATFNNTGRHIVVRGKFHTSIELHCARCLNPYKMELNLPIEEELPIPGHTPEMHEREAEAEEEEISEEDKNALFQDNLLDLTELIRQSILVEVPIKSLCSEECAGICPGCGKSLNEEPCECKIDIESSPFSALASLMEQDEESESQ